MGGSKKDAGELNGRTENNRVVNFAAPVGLIGRFADVRIDAALPNSLRGTLVGAAAADGRPENGSSTSGGHRRKII
jgi:tRNA-2-methylthio-N6-dimethylallyladenosine synthase